MSNILYQKHSVGQYVISPGKCTHYTIPNWEQLSSLILTAVKGQFDG